MKRRPAFRSAPVAIRWLALAALILLAPILSGAIPGWWVSRGVVASGTPAPGESDFAALNLGQLKTLAFAAYEEMSAPLSAGVSAEIETLIKSWCQTETNGTIRRGPNGRPIPRVPTSVTADFAAVNVGQLKTVAQPFYERLIAIGYVDDFPWASSTDPASDFAMANVGQAKTLLSFDVRPDTDGDGMPDWWERRHGTNPSSAGVPGETTIFWAMPNTAAYALGYSRTESGDARLAPRRPNVPPPPEVSAPPPPPSMLPTGHLTTRQVLTAERRKFLRIDSSVKYAHLERGNGIFQPAYYKTVEVTYQSTDKTHLSPHRGNNDDADVRFDTIETDDPRDYGFDDKTDDGTDTDGNGDPDDRVESFPPQRSDSVDWEEYEENFINRVPPDERYYTRSHEGVEDDLSQAPRETQLYRTRIWSADRWLHGQQSEGTSYIPLIAGVGSAQLFGARYGMTDKLGWMGSGYAGVLGATSSAIRSHRTEVLLWDDPPEPTQSYTSIIEDATLEWSQLRVQTNIAPPPGVSISTLFAIDKAVTRSGSTSSTFLGIITLTIDPGSLVANRSQVSPAPGQTIGGDMTSFEGGAATINLQPSVTLKGERVRLTATPMPVEMMVDANRDGEMSFDNSSPDQTTAQKPYRFWVNNDYDTEEADATGAQDSQNNTIDYKRDLEDFTRLWISFKGITEMLKTGGITLQLEWKPMDGSANWPADAGSPGIKVFKAVEADGDKNYVEEDTWAGQQLVAPYNGMLADVRRGPAVPLPLSTITLTNLTETNPNVYLLFEGVTAGKGRLVLNLMKGTQKIGEYPPLYLDIRDIKNMYERWTVDSSANVPSSGADPWETAVPCPWRLPAGQDAAFQYGAQSPEEKKYIVFAHGWNMAPAEKDMFAETAFKRLWWQGYKGRFAAFQWPTTHSFDPTVQWWQLATNRESYDKGDFIAWRSGPALARLLSQLNGRCPGQVHLKGHSMGNVVSGEAMRLLGRSGGAINTYVACEAAVQAACYDPATNTNFPLNFGYLGGNFGPTTPDIFPNWLTPNSAGVGKKVNFYNVNDYALNVGVWEFDQISKPDNTGIGTRWGWDVLWAVNTDDQFWRYTPPDLTVTRLYLGTQADPKDQYEIMAYAAEPRSRALGRVSGNVAGFGSTHNMPGEGMWSYDPHNNQFQDREWHSGQFQFTNMVVRNFWDRLLQAYQLKSPQ